MANKDKKAKKIKKAKGKRYGGSHSSRKANRPAHKIEWNKVKSTRPIGSF